jgi:signal transduction histidine kinase
MMGVARRAAAQPLLVDGVIAVLLTVIAQAQAAANVSLVDRGLLLVMTGVVAVRRRAPLFTALTVAGAAALMAITPQQPSVFGEYLALILAAYTVAERRSIRFAVVGGLAMVGGVIVHDLASPDYDTASAIAGDLVVPVLIWGLGRVVHFQNARADRAQVLLQQLEHDQADLARRAVAAERAHLARELHDIVTHSLSVVVIQSQGAQRVLDGPEPQVRRSLADIETAGRTALTEMRRLLGLLREDELTHAVGPGLADISDLLAQVRAAGLTVQFTESGAAGRVDPAVELSVYRVVQEAMTNALKYAPGSTVTVRIDHDTDSIDVHVLNDGAGPPSPRAGGHGLLGMRERVSLYGGTLEVGALENGGFGVRARLPLREA